MKLLSFAIPATFLLFSSLSLAYDMTSMPTVKAHETATFNIDLPADHAMINIWEASDTQKITCIFFDKENNQIFEAKDVSDCAGQTHLDLPAEITAKVSNNTNKDLQLRIWVRNVK